MDFWKVLVESGCGCLDVIWRVHVGGFRHFDSRKCGGSQSSIHGVWSPQQFHRGCGRFRRRYRDGFSEERWWFLIVPALVIGRDLAMKSAVSASLVIVAAKCLIGFCGDRQLSVSVD